MEKNDHNVLEALVVHPVVQRAVDSVVQAGTMALQSQTRDVSKRCDKKYYGDITLSFTSPVPGKYSPNLWKEAVITLQYDDR